jgi:O-antigen/teichoic acid export membrane protein
LGVALSGTEGVDMAGRLTLARRAVEARVRSWLGDSSDRMIAQRVAGAAFLIRLFSAAIIYLTQVLLARWMGRFEFGIYVYVWTWVGLIGGLAPLGIAYSAQRFIPQYRAVGDREGLRGFLRGGRWLCFGLGTAAACVVSVLVLTLGDRIAPYYFVPFLLGCAALPIFTVSSAQDSIARSFNWIDLALLPGFILQPVIILLAMASIRLSDGPTTATTALIAASGGMWAIALIQLALLNRRLARDVPAGPHRYEIALWLKTALPIFLVDSFFFLLTYVDILVLQLFVGPAEIATYYAVVKTLIIVNFIYFAVAAASAHRFSQYHAAGEREKLAAFVRDTVRWTFWPSLLVAFVLLALGKPILTLFGPGFADGYPLMFVLAIGLVARAALGPAERLLNMVGEQRICAAIYGTAFATNLTLCLVLIPRFGLPGAAVATTTAVLVEATLLFIVTRRRLGLHVFPFGRAAASPASAGR